MKYYVVKMILNTQGQDVASVDIFNDLESALVTWHNTLASFHNADDLRYAVVEILNYYGNVEKLEIVDHTIRPEPEPEPEEE